MGKMEHRSMQSNTCDCHSRVLPFFGVGNCNHWDICIYYLAFWYLHFIAHGEELVYKKSVYFFTNNEQYIHSDFHSSNAKKPCSNAPGNWNLLSIPLKVTTIRPPSMPLTCPIPNALCLTIVPAFTPEVSTFTVGLG